MYIMLSDHAMMVSPADYHYVCTSINKEKQVRYYL